MKVKTILTTVLAALFLMSLSVGFSVADIKGMGNSKAFVDANGDGINDNAPDVDGDGIPNGRDPDYTGTKARNGGNSKGFVDANGDGINDNALDDDKDGIPNGKDPDYVKPQDGNGQKRGNMGKNSGNANRGFIDENGDGINDLALDSDGDGIQNCSDPDYVPAGQAKGKTRSHIGRFTKSGNTAGANLAPIRDRLQDGSCGTCDGTGFKKIRNVRKIAK